MVSITTVPSLGGVQDHQTERPPARCAWFGSPGSRVAPTFEPVTDRRLLVARTNALVLATNSLLSVTGSNVGATREPGEPNHAHLAGGRSVWWSWTPPRDGTVVIDTIGSAFDTVLAVY